VLGGKSWTVDGLGKLGGAWYIVLDISATLVGLQYIAKPSAHTRETNRMQNFDACSSQTFRGCVGITAADEMILPFADVECNRRVALTSICSPKRTSLTSEHCGFGHSYLNGTVVSTV
jgi:hypothetical protein